MDYKKRYEVQMKINEELNNKNKCLQDALGEMTDERDKLAKKVEQLEAQLVALEDYRKELKEQIDKARQIREQCSESLEDIKKVKRKYRNKLLSIIFNSGRRLRKL